MSNIAHTEREPWLSHDPRVYLPHTARARVLQSEAFGRGFTAAGRVLARISSNAVRTIAGTMRRRATIKELSKLDDSLLVDIGIDRTQIPMVAQGLITRDSQRLRRFIPVAPCTSLHHGEPANDSTAPAIAA